MKTSNIAIWTAPLLAASAIALSGCGQRSASNPTAISYRQIGVCKTWTSPAGTEEKAHSDEIYAIFKIESVDNTKPSNNFTFDPQRFYVNQSTAEQMTKNLSYQNRRFIEGGPRFAQAMGVKAPGEMTNVKGGEKLDVNAYVIAAVSPNLPADKPPVGNSFDLTYDMTTAHEQSQTSEGIVMAKTNAGAAVPVVESCKELAYN
jgi:hypothetical protein